MGIEVLDSFGNLKATGELFTNLTSTSTGTQNNWNPGVNLNTFIEWSGASDITITGIAGGVAGNLLIFVNTGTKNAYFTNNDSGSSSINRLKNLVGSSSTPVGVRGWISYMHDGTEWKLVNHNQGSSILVAYSAGNFTTDVGTWTVDAGDQIDFSYILIGSLLYLNIRLAPTTIASNPVELRVTIPNGFSSSAVQAFLPGYANDGTILVTSVTLVESLGTTYIRATRTDVANWPNVTNGNYLYYTISILVS